MHCHGLIVIVQWWQGTVPEQSIRRILHFWRLDGYVYNWVSYCQESFVLYNMICSGLHNIIYRIMINSIHHQLLTHCYIKHTFLKVADIISAHHPLLLKQQQTSNSKTSKKKIPNTKLDQSRTSKELAGSLIILWNGKDILPPRIPGNPSTISGTVQHCSGSTIHLIFIENIKTLVRQEKVSITRRRPHHLRIRKQVVKCSTCHTSTIIVWRKSHDGKRRIQRDLFGDPTSENTWEPMDHLRKCTDLISIFL